ncbi:MAG TPA: hypothetical protein VGN42_03090, partial [Pirellulales bacterium]|nr:hypothetical protein [Pirellulales bacterium]
MYVIKPRGQAIGCKSFTSTEGRRFSDLVRFLVRILWIWEVFKTSQSPKPYYYPDHDYKESTPCDNPKFASA